MVSLDVAMKIAATMSSARSPHLMERFGVDGYPPDVLDRAVRHMVSQSDKLAQLDAIYAVLKGWEKAQPLTPEAEEQERIADEMVADGRLPAKFRR